MFLLTSIATAACCLVENPNPPQKILRSVNLKNSHKFHKFPGRHRDQIGTKRSALD